MSASYADSGYHAMLLNYHPLIAEQASQVEKIKSILNSNLQKSKQKFDVNNLEHKVESQEEEEKHVEEEFDFEP